MQQNRRPLRRTPIRRVSKKRAREQRLRTTLLRAYAGPGPVLCEVPDCRRVAVDAHEVLTRARGGSITDLANIKLLCREHHDEIGTEPPWAYDLGLLAHSWGE